MDTATTILKQLGGNRFIAMTGAKNFGILANDQGIGFKIPMHHKIQYVRIYLTAMDLYDMEFLDRKVETIKRIDGLYSDQLQAVFTSETGLYTSL